MRETAVTALLELYNDEDKVAPMHELTERFTPRFAQLIHDIHEGVAVKGVSLTAVHAALCFNWGRVCALLVACTVQSAILSELASSCWLAYCMLAGSCDTKLWQCLSWFGLVLRVLVAAGPCGAKQGRCPS